MECELRAGEVGEVRAGNLTLPSGGVFPLSACSIDPQATLSFYYEDTKMDPVSLPPNHEAPPAAAPVAAQESPVEAPAAPAAQATPVKGPELTAHTEVPAPAPADANPLDLAKLGGDNPIAVIVLAGVAILGGGTAWKFYNKKAEMTHEMKMKELEMKSQSPSQSPPPCIVKHTELDAKLAAVEAKLSKLDKKTSSLSIDGDSPSTEELDSRLIKIEKTVKAMKAGK